MPIGVTDGYSKVKEDVEFRRLCAANVGLGFGPPSQNPTEKADVARNARNNANGEPLSVTA